MWLAVHTQQQNPHRILTLLLQHSSVSKIGQKFRAESAIPNITISQHSLNAKISKAPTKQQVFFSRQNTFHTQFKIPINIMHELPHNHSKNPRHVHPLACVSPYRYTCNNSGPFPDILRTAQVFSSGFFSFNLLDQILLLPIYNTPKSKSNHTFQFSLQAQSLSFPIYHTIAPCLHFLSLPQISFSSSHLFASPKSPCQFPSRNLIHRSLKTFSLGYRNYTPSQQLTPFVMTCK